MSAELTSYRLAELDPDKYPHFAWSVAEFVDEAYYGHEPSLRDVEETHWTLFEEGSRCYLLLSPEEEWVGVASIKAPPEAVATLGFLAVKPGWRGRGIGTEILRRTEEIAIKASAPYLSHVPQSDKAEAFLSRRGYMPHLNQVINTDEMIKVF